MNNHRFSPDDEEFKDRFQKCGIAPSDFDHRSHLRIAYIYLCEAEPEMAYSRMRRSLQGFLAHHGVDPKKYHETLTRAWMMAVYHFMCQSPPLLSASEFIERNPILSKSEVMLSHYSRE